MMVHLTRSERNEMKKVKRAEEGEQKRSEEQRPINYLINTMYLFSHLRIPTRSPVLLCQICRPHSLHCSSPRWQVWIQLVGSCARFISIRLSADKPILAFLSHLASLYVILLYVESLDIVE